MCNAYNHPPDCTCGWGGEGHAGGGGNYYTPSKSWVERPIIFHASTTFQTYVSYTNPNAKCPVCDAAVFFYQSPYGGRVFFDELGPPWPKHPCTDSVLGKTCVEFDTNLTPVVIQEPEHRITTVPQWQREGWEIYICEKLIEKDSDPAVKLKGKLTATNMPLDLFVVRFGRLISMEELEHIHIKKVCSHAGRFVFEAAYVRQDFYDKVARINKIRLTAYTTLQARNFRWSDDYWVDNFDGRYKDLQSELNDLVWWFIEEANLPDKTFTLPSGAKVKNPSNYYDGLHIFIKRGPTENVIPYARSLVKKLRDLYEYVKLHGNK